MGTSVVSGQIADGVSISAGLTSIATGSGGSNFPLNVTNGNLIIVRVGAGSASTHSAPTDSLGSSWTQIGTTFADATVSFSSWYAFMPSTGANTITGNFSSSTGATIIAVELTGCDPSTPISVSVTPTVQAPAVGADTVTSGNIALTIPGTSGLLLAFNFNASGTVGNAGTGFTDYGAWVNVVGANRMRVEAKAITNNANTAATFQQAVGTDNNYVRAIIINDPLIPYILAQPKDLVIKDGDRWYGQVIELLGTSYQWQNNTGAGWNNIIGATLATYQTGALATGDTGTQYRCVITNTKGSTTSSAATVTVNTALTANVGHYGKYMRIGGWY